MYQLGFRQRARQRSSFIQSPTLTREQQITLTLRVRVPSTLLYRTFRTSYTHSIIRQHTVISSTENSALYTQYNNVIATSWLAEDSWRGGGGGRLGYIRKIETGSLELLLMVEMQSK